jgi:hypothetical protein
MKSAAFAVRGSVLKWRARQDETGHCCIAAVIQLN